ncbi:hypothetical protein [Maribacter dokdonensis]|uniref:hypothetical protein n=1 Tax=Maribacter dokdonensis TaxID=320912 RepID=UPI002734EC8C|nr:hypothetical protein [Maribacter dokdonensis]MDP2525638.1 hypothetical protein [Maribacter dokdonensis]
MSIDNAIKRLIWRFEKFNIIMVNNNDIDALNTVVKYINNIQAQKPDIHPHFSKLYVSTLKNFTDKYDTNLDNQLINIKIKNLLSTPFNFLIEDFTSQMNSRLQYKLIELAEYGLSINHVSQCQASKQLAVTRLDELLKHEGNKKIFNGKSWTSQEVESGINKQINTFLYGI